MAFPAQLLQGQQPAETTPPPRQQDLAQFEGLYQYRDGLNLGMVGANGRLIAIIGDAKYPLRHIATDTFANGGGDRIPFVRDAAGRVVAFQENGDTFKRLSPSVSTELRQLLVARAPGPDGRVSRYRCASPRAMNDGIAVSAPGKGTLPCDVAERIVNGIVDGTYSEVRSVVVYHRDQLVLEDYFYGYDQGRMHQMRSLTKSVISLLAAAAIDRGLLRPDEPVYSRLGYDTLALSDARKRRITLAHLLSNQSGLACDDRDGNSPGNEMKLYDARDWVASFAELPVVAEPGTVGRYCSFGFHTAGRVVERAVGMPLADFAQQVLFAPLGVSRSDWRWQFVLNNSQRNEFGQIYLRPRDMLKLGILIQQRGKWQGTQVISPARIDAAVAKLSRVDDSDYGLGIWHRWYNVTTPAGSQRVETIMLSGNGGQKIFVVPTLDLIVVFTGGAFNTESPVNTILVREVLPSLLAAPAAGERR
jgi:CubicO group peptidase (beta-lactamase class C family)